VHVAGSKGKATTSTHIANILTAAGFRTGLFTSPHLHSWRERISIDGEMIAQTEFGQVGDRVLSVVQDFERLDRGMGAINASEMLLAMALTHFSQSRCHFAVIEVGLGGRYDATNVVTPDVTVITELELEHAAILGPALADIAWNKGGIIKSHIPVVALRPPVEAERVLREIATEMEAPMRMEEREWVWKATDNGVIVETPHRTIGDIVPSAPGQHQRQNAALAAVAVSQIEGADLPPSDDAIRAGIRHTRLLGHFEIVETDRGNFVLDVAHTPQSIDLLIKALQEVGIVRPRVVAGFLNDKEIEDIVGKLAAVASSVTLAPVRNPRSASLEQIVRAAAPWPSVVRTVSQMSSALFPADSQTDEPDWTVVTGSSALVAESRERLGLAKR
jgi:dihydrofolate synthase/folylpolyglutamate synthase